MSISQHLTKLSLAKQQRSCYRPRLSQGLIPSCSTRVLVLINVSKLAQISQQNEQDTNINHQKHYTAAAAAASATAVVDGLRLSVLRVLSQLSLTCPQDSCVEWAVRFFDSRHGGIGKTPSELKARLRSRRAAPVQRGFTRLSRESFQAFGDACVTVACGLQGDPLARDRQLALRRWSHGRAKLEQPRYRIDPNVGRATTPSCSDEHRTARGAAGSYGSNGLSGGSDDDGPRRMYDGHDMSSHEVLVRSLLEVLQEFGEATESERAVGAPESSSEQNGQRLLLLVDGDCPQTEDEVEVFALQGNFTAQAATVAMQPSEERARALAELLNAGIGKAVRRCCSHGVVFQWQDGPPGGEVQDRRGNISGPAQHVTSLDRCLAAAGYADILRWSRTVGSTGLLPISAALGERLSRRISAESVLGWRSAEVGRPPLGDTAAVAVALGGGGVADARLTATRLSCGQFRGPRPGKIEIDGLASLREETVTPSILPHSTPWRLMGTLPLSEVWPGVLVGQGLGATVVLRAENADGALRWRTLLGYLLAGGLAASISLPRGLFRVTTEHSNENFSGYTNTSDGFTVALLMPINEECAVGWSVAGGEVDVGSSLQSPRLRSPLLMGTAPCAEQGAAADAPSQFSLADSLCRRTSEVDRTLRMRQAELGLALQEAILVRRKRCHGKTLPAVRLRSLSSTSSTAAARAAGREGLSPRDSVSLCFTGEHDMGGASTTCSRQWRLELESEPSHTSGSPRDFRRLQATMGTGEDEDELTSSVGSSSGPRRALHLALEDASSRSSLGSRDADFSSTPGSKETRGSSGTSFNHPLETEDTLLRRGGRQKVDGLSSLTEVDEGGITIPAEPIDGGVSELPLSFMSEPTLACLPSALLPTELVTLAERCAMENRVAAASRIRTAAANEACAQAGAGFPESRAAQGFRKVRARQLFIAAVRAAERRGCENSLKAAAAEEMHVRVLLREDALETGPQALEGKAMEDKAVADTDENHSAVANRNGRESPAPHEGSGVSAVATFEHDDHNINGVEGLRRQYLEVAGGGHRSPVDFVVRTVPEAIRDLVEAYVDSNKTNSAAIAVDTAVGDQRAKASALVLAAVVKGLTSSAEELAAKHKAKRGAKPAAVDLGHLMGRAGEMGHSVATPAMQKVRDYQLQALLLCQLNILAMDLPDIPEAVAAFSALATAGAGGKNLGDKDNKEEKGKGKANRKRKRKSGGGKDKDSDPIRPSDPLPDARRTRLGSFLQPISTMLDSCTVTRATIPAGDGAGGAGNGGRGVNSSRNEVTNASNSSRAYDGTLADFMGLALVEHFASRIPRTLSALFDDFERLPPDSLTAALTKSSTRAPSDGGTMVGLTGGEGDITGEEETAGKEVADVVEPALSGTRAALENSRATAGILLSDRTSVSHHHFKMSSLLNGFREVKLKAHPSSGGGISGGLTEGPSVNKQISVCGVGGRKAGKDSEHNGSWRTSTAGVGGGRGSRSRAARDSKPAGDLTAAPELTRAPRTTELSVEVRHSPRLARRRPGGEAATLPDDADSASITISSSKQRSSPSSSTSQSTNQCRKRRRVSSPSGRSSPLKSGVSRSGGVGSRGGRSVAPRTRSGVLVGETPRKRSAAEAAASMRTSRCGGTDNSTGGRGSHAEPAAAITVLPSSPAAPGAACATEGTGAMPLAPLQERGPPAPPDIASAAQEGRARRGRRVTHYPCPEANANANAQEAMPSPPSWRSASAASRLFVEESPSTIAGARNGCRSNEWASAGSSESGEGGISCQLMATESASPIARRRTVVPDTPVC